MIIFTLVLFLVLYLLVDIINKSEYSKRSKIAFYCTAFLIFLSGFRHLAVGVDTAYYAYSLREVSKLSFGEVFSSFFSRYFSASNAMGKDPGFLVFEKIFSLFTTNSTIYLLFIGAVFLIPLRFFFIKYTRTSWELVFSYIVYITLFFNYLPNAAIRQAIALSVLLYVYSRIDDFNWKKSVILILLASFVHQSVLAGLAILVFPKIKNVKSFFLICGLLFFLMFFVGNIFASFITSFSDVYSSYVDSDYYSRGNAKPYNFTLLMFAVYAMGLLKMKNKKFVNDNLFLYKMLGISMIVTPLILVQPNFQRFTAIFAISVCVFIPRCLSEYSTSIRKLAYALLILVFMNTTKNFNYKFNWQQMEFHERYLYMNVD